MQIFKLDSASDLDRRYLFPEEIETNPWIGYHATSSCCEEGIERLGLLGSHLVTADQVYGLRRIFESINWHGIHQGGYGVLMAFSSARTMGIQTPPIYLDSFPKRCLLYTTRDFVGGETLRAVGYAVQDLERFIQDSQLRQEHLKSQIDFSRANFDFTGQKLRVIDVNLEWLDEELTPYRSLARVRSNLELSYRWGTLYAIRFDREELRNLEDGHSEAIRFFGELAPENIVAKVQLPDLGTEAALGIANTAKLEYLRRLASKSCLQDLRHLISTKSENSVQRLNVRNTWLTESELDTRAGRNIAESVL